MFIMGLSWPPNVVCLVRHSTLVIYRLVHCLWASCVFIRNRFLRLTSLLLAESIISGKLWFQRKWRWSQNLGISQKRINSDVKWLKNYKKDSSKCWRAEKTITHLAGEKSSIPRTSVFSRFLTSVCGLVQKSRKHIGLENLFTPAPCSTLYHHSPRAEAADECIGGWWCW